MRLLRTVAGFTALAIAGLPVGYLVYATASLFLLPQSLWMSDALMWAFLTLSAGLFGVVGAFHGWRQDPASRIWFRACAGFVTGALVAVVVALGLLFAVLWLADRASADTSIVFAFIFLWPFGLLGGAIGAWRAASRARRQP